MFSQESSSTLMMGSQGQEVLNLQRLLYAASIKHSRPNLNPGNQNGFFGKETDSAVKNFLASLAIRQKSAIIDNGNGSYTVVNLVEPNIISALEKVVASASGTVNFQPYEEVSWNLTQMPVWGPIPVNTPFPIIKGPAVSASIQPTISAAYRPAEIVSTTAMFKEPESFRPIPVDMTPINVEAAISPSYQEQIRSASIAQETTPIPLTAQTTGYILDDYTSIYQFPEAQYSSADQLSSSIYPEEPPISKEVLPVPSLTLKKEEPPKISMTAIILIGLAALFLFKK